MFDGTAEQHLAVTARILARKDLTPDAQLVFLALSCRIYEAKQPLPVKRYPFAQTLPLNAVSTALAQLQRVGLGKTVSKLDGRHFIINRNHLVFAPAERAPVTLSSFITQSLKTVSTAEMVEIWRDLYMKQFGSFPDRDPKDLIRLRHVIRNQGANALDALTQYVYRHRLSKTKCTVYGLFMACGRSKKV